MFPGDVSPSPGCMTILCPLLHGDKDKMVALGAASNFRRVLGSDPGARELVSEGGCGVR